MPTDPQHVPDAEMPKRRSAYLWVGLVLLLVIIAIDFAPYEIPGIFGVAGNDGRHFLTLQLFSLGQVSISILSLLKAALFLLVLSAIA